MKLVDLYEAKKRKGTYAGLKLDSDSVDKLVAFCKDNDIPNPVPAADMHCTLLFSRKFLPKYEPAGKLSPGFEATPKGYDIWDSNSGEKRCLVLKLKSKDCVERHKKLMDEHKGTFDFPTYVPHVTLSYDIGDELMDKLDISDIGPLLFVKEYFEELDLDWKPKSDK